MNKFDKVLHNTSTCGTEAGDKAYVEVITKHFQKNDKDDNVWIQINLEQLQGDLNWQALSWSAFVPWSIELIRSFEDKWDWYRLSQNEALPWSKEFIIEFEKLLKFDKLSKNRKIPWDEELILSYKDKWDWEKLSSNKSIKWSIDFIYKCKDKIKWGWFLYNLEKDSDLFILLCLFKDKIPLNSLFKSETINWIHIFNHRQTLSLKSISKELNIIIDYEKVNIQLEYSDKFSFMYLEYFKDFWDLSASQFYHIKFTPKEWDQIIYYHLDKLNPYELSSVEGIYSFTWSKLLPKFMEEWNWEEIVKNKSIRWENYMVKRYAKYFPWRGHGWGRTGHYNYSVAPIIYCTHIKLSSEILSMYTDSWRIGVIDGCENPDSEGDWNVFSSIGYINYDILTNFIEKLNIKRLISREDFNWNKKEIIFLRNYIRDNDNLLEVFMRNKSVRRIIEIDLLKNLE